MTSVDELARLKRKLRQRYVIPPVIPRNDLQIDGVAFTPSANITFSYPIALTPANEPVFLRSDSEGNLVVRDVASSEIYADDPNYNYATFNIQYNSKIALNALFVAYIYLSSSYTLPTVSDIVIDYMYETHTVTALLKSENFVGNISLNSVWVRYLVYNSSNAVAFEFTYPLQRPVRVSNASRIVMEMKIAIPSNASDFQSGDYIYLAAFARSSLRYKTV